MAILNDIASALTGSVASDGQTPQTGQLRGLVGINPAYSFTGDLNTGFGSDVAEEVYLQANGVKTLRATAAGLQITGTFLGTITSTGTTVGFVGYEAISTEAGAAAGPIISTFRDSVSPAAADQIGAVDFNGRDSAANKELYARLIAIVDDPVSGSEDARLAIAVAVAGALATRGEASATGWDVTGTSTATVGFKVGANPTAVPGKTPTTQEFLSGSGNYTPTVGTVWIRVRAVAGGGGGGGTGGVPASGTASLFNGIQANPGAAGTNANGSGAGGAGGTAGGGVANVRINGAQGGNGTGVAAGSTDGGTGGNGGGTHMGPGGGTNARPAPANTGGGGGASQGATPGDTGGGAGGGGEYFELILPAAVYAYTVGTGGAAGTSGGAGAAGRIIVEEYYS